MLSVDVHGIHLYFFATGSGETLLFVHGLGSSERDRAFQMPAFASHHRVIACDLRGHGQSGKLAGPYSMTQFAADTGGCCRQLMRARCTWWAFRWAAWWRCSWSWMRPKWCEAYAS
jgi:pimeloyl-ACP methyl ester carboxylesterase